MVDGVPDYHGRERRSGERALGEFMGRITNAVEGLQEDMVSVKVTVENLKTKSSVAKGAALGVAGVTGIAGGTLGSKILAAFVAAFSHSP